MTPAAFADAVISAIALAGVVCVAIANDRQGIESGLSRRFSFLIVIVVLILVCRIIFWSSGLAFFEYVTLASASLIPLCSLLLAEGLLRRHFPRWLKFAISFGTVIAFCTAFIPATDAYMWRSVLFVSFQLFALTCIGTCLVLRDRASLSGAENLLVDRIGLSFLAISPVLITDYRELMQSIPIRMGSLGILGFCWITLDGELRGAGWMSSVKRLIGLTVVGILVGLCTGLVLEQNVTGLVRASAIAAAGALLVAIVSDSFRTRIRHRRENLLQALADPALSDRVRLVRELQQYPLVAGSLLIEGIDLGNFCISHGSDRRLG